MRSFQRVDDLKSLPYSRTRCGGAGKAHRSEAAGIGLSCNQCSLLPAASFVARHVKAVRRWVGLSNAVRKCIDHCCLFAAMVYLHPRTRLYSLALSLQLGMIS
eukprot:6187112-Pleurochrysis_carterae.AAC.1